MQFTDFLTPAIRGLSESQQRRIAVAMDCAIAFGAMQHADGNESLQDRAAVQAKYNDNLKKLRTLGK